MYSDTEIETAVASGAIDRATADRLRASIAAQRHSAPADDEQFRLVTGFNDIFVTIASALVVFAAGSIVGGLAVAAVSWGLAEYFTRKKRMALPSIFLLLCFSGGLFGFLMHLVSAATLTGRSPFTPEHGAMDAAFLLGTAAAGCITAVGVALHWRRFHVPITIAAGALSVSVIVAALFMLLLYAVGVPGRVSVEILPWFAFAIGVGMFAFAMRWDLSDPERVTRRSDVAFWLHLAASPLIVHPMFLEVARLGAGNAGPGAQLGAALLAILLYIGLAMLALVVDRRAVLVSALAYVVIAIGYVMHSDGHVGSNIASSGAVIGGLLLVMSVFWRDLRGLLLRNLPARLRIRLPEAPVA